MSDLIERLNDPHRRLVLSDRQEAAEALKRMVAHIEELQAKVTCMCGDSADHDSWAAGHSPVSMFDHAVEQEVMRRAGLLATAAGAVIADWSADCKVEDETIAKLLEAYNAAGCQRALLEQVEAALD